MQDQIYIVDVVDIVYIVDIEDNMGWSIESKELD